MFLWDWFAGILNYLGKNSIESKKKNQHISMQNTIKAEVVYQRNKSFVLFC